MHAEPSVLQPSVFPAVTKAETAHAKGGNVLAGQELQNWLGSQSSGGAIGVHEDTVAKATEKERLISQADKALQRRIWLVQGCVNLDHIEAILHAVSPCSRVIVLVVDPLTAWEGGADKRKLSSLTTDERLFLVTPGTPVEQAQAVNTLFDLRLFTEWKPILGKAVDAGGIKHLQDFYQNFTPLINLKAIDRSTRLHSSHLFLSNALINAVFAQQINKLIDYKDIYKNKPVLIVATGPSLNKQLETLKQNKDQFVIVAVDPAVPILKKYGIIPQYVVSIDPRKRPYWQHNELDPSTTFLIEIGCCPDVAWSSNHNYLVTSCHKDVHRLLNALGIPVPLMLNGGSVATCAFNFATFTGANPIVMIGQDLAWTGGKDHAEGYVSQYSQDILNARYERGFEVEGYDGHPVKTEKQLMGYKTWFEQRIQAMPETMVINATEGGAKIHGAVQIPFEAVCKELSVSFGGDFSAGPSKPWSLSQDYLKSYLKEIKNIYDQTVDLRKNILEGIGLIRKINKTPKKSTLNKLASINHILVHGDWRLNTIIEMMGQRQVMESEQKLLSDQNKKYDSGNIYQNYLNIYNSALPGINDSIKLMQKMLKLIEDIVVKNEIHPQFLMNENLNRWNADGSNNKAAF